MAPQRVSLLFEIRLRAWTLLTVLREDLMETVHTEHFAGLPRLSYL
jgi:hypothetical protein